MSHAELEKRLEKFVRYFVEKFERYFADAHARFTERRPRPARWVESFEEFVGISKSAGETLEGAPKAIVLIALDVLVKGVKMKTTSDDWDKLKKFGHKLLKYGVDNPMVRNGLIEGAVDIFAKFEAQFMNVTTDAGWESAIIKIAEDAVNRVISYLRNSELMIDEKAISKCLISGESKKYWNAKGFPNFHRGHTIQLLGIGITTKQMFKNLGVKINEEYHVPKITKRQIPFNKGAWFRHLFEWESMSTTDMDKLRDAPPDPYTYVLVGEVLDDKLQSIKSILEKERPNQENKEVFQDLKSEMLRLIGATEKIQEITTETLETVNEIKDISSEILDKIDRDEKKRELVETPIWSVPNKRVLCFTGRKTELGNLHEQVLREISDVLSLITVISGLGGIGKTQLALAYAHKYREMFFDVVWLDAENEKLLRESFVELARVVTPDTDGKEMQTPTIVKMVYNYFRERKSPKNSLFIFDNAEKSYDLRAFLPNYDDSSIADPSYGKIRILMTSREQEWFIGYPEVKILPLYEFSHADAVDLIKTRLNNDNDEGIEELVTAVQHYPLALEQAVAYIIDERVANLDYSITNYLIDYKRKAKELLNDEVFQKPWKAYEETTYTTWTLTMTKISSAKHHGELAVEMMNIIAFLRPNDIHREMFFLLENVKETDVRQAVRLLANHSMVNGGEGQKVISVHRLVQDVTRLHMTDRDREKYRNQSLALMGSYALFHQPTYKKMVAYFENFANLLFSTNQDDHTNFDMFIKTLAWLEQAYQSTHDLTKLKNGIIKEIEIDQTLKRNLPIVSCELGNYREAIDAHKKALSIYEANEDQTMMADSHSKLADIYQGLWEFDRSREHYRKALEILDGHEERNERHVVIKKLRIYLNLRIVDNSITTDLLRETLRLWEEINGEARYSFSPRDTLVLVEAYMRIGDKGNEVKCTKEFFRTCEKFGRGKSYAQMICDMNNVIVQRNLDVNLESHLKISLEIFIQTEGSSHIETSKCMASFARFYFKQGNREKGFQLMEEALVDMLLECEYSEVQGGLFVRLGVKYNEIGEHENAIFYTVFGLSILGSCYEQSSIQVYSALEALAFIHETTGNTEQQRVVCHILLDITQENCKEGDYKLARAQVKYGRTLELLDAEQSKELVEKGMAILQTHYGTREHAEAAVSTPFSTFIN